MFLCGSTILCVCLVLLGIHKPLLSAMSLSGESMEIGSHMLMIYCVAAVIRMCNWVQNDTYRAAGDAAFGTIREIAFMYAMVLPLVCLTGLVWKAPFLIVFACCYIDEPIRLILMQRHMYSGKWCAPLRRRAWKRCRRLWKSMDVIRRRRKQLKDSKGTSEKKSFFRV